MGAPKKKHIHLRVAYVKHPTRVVVVAPCNGITAKVATAQQQTTTTTAAKTSSSQGWVALTFRAALLGQNCFAAALAVVAVYCSVSRVSPDPSQGSQMPCVGTRAMGHVASPTANVKQAPGPEMDSSKSNFSPCLRSTPPERGKQTNPGMGFEECLFGSILICIESGSFITSQCRPPSNETSGLI